jgi:hypothetical protein
VEAPECRLKEALTESVCRSGSLARSAGLPKQYSSSTKQPRAEPDDEHARLLVAISCAAEMMGKDRDKERAWSRAQTSFLPWTWAGGAVASTAVNGSIMQ